MIHFTKVNGYLVRLEQPDKYRELDIDTGGRITEILGGVAVFIVIGAMAVLGICF